MQPYRIWILKYFHKNAWIFSCLYFQGYARNLEQPELKDWLANTKDMLMGEKSGPDKEKAAKALNAILER